MKNKSDNSQGTKLRRQAEEKLIESKKKGADSPAQESDTRRLVHELEVHEIELEMQNEELVKTRAEVEALLRQYTDLYDFAPAGYFTLARDGAIHQVNLAGANLLGVERGELTNRRFGVFVSARSRSTFNTYLENVFGSQQKVTCEVEIERDGSAPLWVHIEAFTKDGRECSAVVVEITERKKAEEALRKSEERFRTLFENSLDAIGITSKDGVILDVNQAWLDLFGYTREETIGNEVLMVYRRPDDRTLYLKEVEKKGYFKDYEIQYVKKDGTLIDCLISTTLNRDQKGLVIGNQSITRDITDLKRTEAERKKLEAQLIQAQKMEAVGRLAGGVAHDFNNMLSIILGHVELALESTDLADRIRADLEGIKNAGMRSADLTRQLLAFARKQAIAPKVLDLNETIEGMLKMLRRLIGEDISLSWNPSHDIWLVKIDPSQIDQILANLCVNARDAISGVGKLTIETANVKFDEAYCVDHAGFMLGEYVMLAVSDNGCGMDKETLVNIFEPFFTTKEMGKGTGLGLSMVYGIVKQNNGFINVYSEPGQGTTFKIYLPRFVGKAEQMPVEAPEAPAPRGHETILLVEDEPAVLELTTMIIERQGYTVLSASTPGKAVRVADEYKGQIHMLITDVVMPEMNGRDLARLLLSLYPNLKCLFMSGYTANVIAHRGVLDEGVHFIQKPFSINDLAAMVRKVLDS